MQANKNIAYYLIAVGLAVLLKFAFRSAGTDSLNFLLKPVDTLTGLLTGSQSVYRADSGYYHDDLNILIEKSCSGFNFWILTFLVFIYVAVKYFKNDLQKVALIPIAFISAYVLTIFVNASRIFVSIVVQNHAIPLFDKQQHLLHEAVGIATNLSFLILFTYMIERYFIKRRNNAKPA